MFDFLSMLGNYEDRCVGRNDYPWGFVSTAAVSDGSKPFETAVNSDEYARADDPTKTDSMVIVEAYNTREQAESGHQKWCALMENDPPAKLIDCYNSGVSTMFEAIGGDATQIRIKK